MDKSEVICFCANVTFGDLEAAVNSGAKSFEEVQERTGISTYCGSCLENAEAIVADLLKK